MKKLIKFFARDWVAKLISLFIAIVIWFLINSQLQLHQPVFYRDALHNETWAD